MLARKTIFVLGCAMILGPSSAFSSLGGEGKKGTIQLVQSRPSALLQLRIDNFRKIGKVAIEVRNSEGRTVYKEEGKAMTGELVRYLDKGLFRGGPHTMEVTTRDLHLLQEFRVDL
ncbi:MAG: hypothetical protein KDB88_11115 [Flavobacteriales bacterium]|nr:hypothetical protein [Flavobacteriales bacterium]